jgi:hypothetical protein
MWIFGDKGPIRCFQVQFQAQWRINHHTHAAIAALIARSLRRSKREQAEVQAVRSSNDNVAGHAGWRLAKLG